MQEDPLVPALEERAESICLSQMPQGVLIAMMWGVVDE